MTGSRTLLAGAVLAGVLLAPMTVTAGSLGYIEADFKGVSPSRSVYIHSSTIHACVTAGVYRWDKTLPDDGPFWTFCVQPTEWLHTSEKRFDIYYLKDLPYLTDHVAALIEELWYQRIDGGAGDTAPGLPLTNGTAAAAFQVAVWEFVDEKEEDSQGNIIYNIVDGEGNFYLPCYDAPGDHTVGDMAQDWINDVLAVSNPGGQIVLYGLRNDESQDQAVLNGNFQMVPLPAAVWGGMVLLGGMGGFAAVRRRLRRG